jgi:hypothetical protein
MYNSLSDAFLVSQYHQEYLTLINRYSNYKRPGPFIRYYNINFDESIKHPETNTTFDIYSTSSIKFDIYELTPTFNITPIVNTTSNQPDKKGQMFDGVSSITIYTVQTPHINDLVTFYDPIKSGEIFRVINIRTSINAYYSDPKLTWYEMDLEVAPILDTSQLKIFKHYIYDTHKEQYYNYNDYKTKTALITTINNKITLIRQYYSRLNDLYYTGIYVPAIVNHVVCYFKDRISASDNSIRLFDTLEKPYGFLEMFPNLAATYDFDQTLQIYNLSSLEFEDYEWDQEETSDLNTLLSLSKDLYELVSQNQNYF